MLIHVELVVDKVALRQVFVSLHQCYAVGTFHQHSNDGHSCLSTPATKNEEITAPQFSSYSMFSISDVLFRWGSLLPVEVGIGISFASEIVDILSQHDYLELECPPFAKVAD